jgi:flagellar biosynthesis/type III secretory pathway ATPase
VSRLERVESDKQLKTEKSLSRKMQSVTQKNNQQIADLKKKLKTETKEKEDYIKKYMLATKEISKLRDLLDHSESIRQN